jgi:hypothetical protein
MERLAASEPSLATEELFSQMIRLRQLSMESPRPTCAGGLGACLGNSGFYWREEGESDSRLA